MTNRATLTVAMDWLASLGCLAQMAHGDERLLIVVHDDDMEDEVRHVVNAVDPASSQIFPPQAC
jgi:hypothetical protein